VPLARVGRRVERVGPRPVARRPRVGRVGGQRLRMRRQGRLRALDPGRGGEARRVVGVRDRAAAREHRVAKVAHARRLLKVAHALHLDLHRAPGAAEGGGVGDGRLVRGPRADEVALALQAFHLLFHFGAPLGEMGVGLRRRAGGGGGVGRSRSPRGKKLSPGRRPRLGAARGACAARARPGATPRSWVRGRPTRAPRAARAGAPPAPPRPPAAPTGGRHPPEASRAGSGPG